MRYLLFLQFYGTGIQITIGGVRHETTLTTHTTGTSVDTSIHNTPTLYCCTVPACCCCLRHTLSITQAAAQISCSSILCDTSKQQYVDYTRILRYSSSIYHIRITEFSQIICSGWSIRGHTLVYSYCCTAVLVPYLLCSYEYGVGVRQSLYSSSRVFYVSFYEYGVVVTCSNPRSHYFCLLYNTKQQ